MSAPRPSSTLQVPSERAAAALSALGGLAPVHAVEERLAARRGLASARLAIDLAIVAGRVGRVAMLDGSPGLELLGGPR